MSLFNNSSKGSKDETARIEKNKKKIDGRIFKIVNTISIVGIFVAIGLVVIGIFGLLKFNAATFGVIGTIASLCIGCWLMMPWVACLEQKVHKKFSIVFITLDVLVPLLWIIAIWFLIGKQLAGTVGMGTLTFIKVVLLISLQFSVISLMANTILRYGKRLIVVQIIAYLSYIYFDFYISYALFCISFSEKKGIMISNALAVLGNKFMLTFFVLSLLYVTIAVSIINGGYRRKRRLGDNMAEMLPEESFEKAEVTKQETLEEKLQKLQNLLDKNLITQEEFEEKRKEIIDKL